MTMVLGRAGLQRGHTVIFYHSRQIGDAIIEMVVKSVHNSSLVPTAPHRANKRLNSAPRPHDVRWMMDDKNLHFVIVAVYSAPCFIVIHRPTSRGRSLL